MNYEFHIQDPTSAGTIYLFEAILEASQGASAWQGIFSFASRAGVDSLIGDPKIQQFLRKSKISLLVGLDAVTTRQTLERLREFERVHQHLCVRVFWNPAGTLFHPKIARFEYPDGEQSIIVGSGNLTLGGLQKNFEAFSVIRASANELLDLSSWHYFERDHASQLRAIDEEVLERAEQNRVSAPRQHGGPLRPGAQALAGAGHHAESVAVVGRTDRFLIAQVPRAGDRWRQIHFNGEVIQQFFRVQHNSSQRVYLMECGQDGSFGDQEVRPCVYSDANMNHKIEVASRRGEPYPEQDSPIALYRELQVRSFAYMLLFPGEPGHSEMLRLTQTLPSLGHGVSRVITESARIRDAWPACPLIKAIDALVEQG